MTGEGRKHCPNGSVTKKEPDHYADALLNVGRSLAAVLEVLEVRKVTHDRWRTDYGGMNRQEVMRLNRW
jgi:hypothetical protein